MNPSFVKIEKQIQDELIETTVINSRNRAATDTIKVAELNDPNLTLNLTQTLAPGLALNADSSVCYDDLGCITRFSFADPILWPINLLPEDRDKIDTHFTLSTRDQSTPWARNDLFLVSMFQIEQLLILLFCYICAAGSWNFWQRSQWNHFRVF